MYDFLYQSGWGALALMLLFQIPFLIVFLYIVYRKSVVDAVPSATHAKKLSRVETLWIGVTVVLFVVVNVASIGYMPMVVTAHAAAEESDIVNVDVSAQSWRFDISDRTFRAGQAVRFSARSVDTMHGFSIYHPDGRILFTLMLMPGLEHPTEAIYKFTEAGKYKIRCLEYCGIAHHGMQDEITVVAGEA